MPSNPMNLTIPVVGETIGPEYAEEVNEDLDLIGAHDHTPGKGNPVPSTGIDIDADLDWAGYALTTVGRVGLDDAEEELAYDACLYQVAGDLYWNNADGIPIQLTNGTAINASAVGGFTGLASTSGAATYASGPGSFTFTSATGVPATVAMGPLVIWDAPMAKKTTISRTAGGSNNAVSLPNANPGSTKIVQWSAAGEITAALAVDDHSLEISGNTLQAKVTPVVQTTAAALAGGQATSYTDITDATVTITTYGRPVMIFAQASGGAGYFRIGSTVGSILTTLLLQLDVSGSATASLPLCTIGATLAANEYLYGPPSLVNYLYAPAAGTYTFKLQYKIASSDTANTYAGASAIKLIAVEM